MRRTGEQLVMQGVRWIESHPSDWRALQDACVLLEAATDSRGRRKVPTVSRDNVYTLALTAGVDIRVDAEYRRDHNLWSTLARYLIKEHPQLSRVIRTKECDVEAYVRAHGLPEIGA